MTREEASELREIGRLVKADLEADGTDFSIATYYPCVWEDNRFRIVDRPFNEWCELNGRFAYVACSIESPIYIFQPTNALNPVRIIDCPAEWFRWAARKTG